MSVVIETTLGDITIDLFLKERPRACLNFLKLCKIKYYNYHLFHTVSRNFIAQTGDPTGSRKGGESIWGVLEGPLKRYFEAEKNPRIKHTNMGLVSFVGNEENMIGSQFFITLGTDLTYLDEQHCVFAEVVEGLDVVEILNEAICDGENRPYQDIRITHTVVLDDPYPDPKNLKVPERSPSPSAERLQGGRIAPDEDIDETMGKSAQEVQELQAEREARARATILEMVGDIPDAEMAPPENVLFVCKLNPVTTDDDLEIIFSRFGKIKSCEIIRDKKTGDSLQYAFVEFEEQKSCEDAYFKMDNVLIDDRRIHVDFSQSVAKVKWHGKGRGVTTYDDKGQKTKDFKNDIGQGRYKSKKGFNNKSEGGNRNFGNGNSKNGDDRRRNERKEYDNRESRRDKYEDRQRRDEKWGNSRDRTSNINKNYINYDKDRNRDRDNRDLRNYNYNNRDNRRYNENEERNRSQDKYANKYYEDERSRKLENRNKDKDNKSRYEERGDNKKYDEGCSSSKRSKYDDDLNKKSRHRNNSNDNDKRNKSSSSSKKKRKTSTEETDESSEDVDSQEEFTKRRNKKSKQIKSKKKRSSSSSSYSTASDDSSSDDDDDNKKKKSSKHNIKKTKKRNKSSSSDSESDSEEKSSKRSRSKKSKRKKSKKKRRSTDSSD